MKNSTKIDDILSELPKNESFTRFVELFYEDLSDTDLQNYQKKDLISLAEKSFSFLSKNLSFTQTFVVNVYDYGNTGLALTIIDIIGQDVPFILDSVIMDIEKRGFSIVNLIHPILNIRESSISRAACDDKNAVSVIQIHLAKIYSEEEISLLNDSIQAVLQNIKFAVEDWQKILERFDYATNQISRFKTLCDIGEIQEFVTWIKNNNFIFLGFGEFVIDGDQLVISGGVSLGIFRQNNPLVALKYPSSTALEIKDSKTNPYIFEILKSSNKSTIHRASYMDRIRIQKFDEAGKVVGEYRFLGLFTSAVYYQPVRNIPIIRQKIEFVIEKSGYIKNSHNYKDLISLLDSYPRDELFQVSKEDLLSVATSIVSLSGRALVRLFIRKDKFNRFISAMIFLPKNLLNTDLRTKMQEKLAECYQGEVGEHYIQLTESNLARLQMMIYTNRNVLNIDIAKIEEELIDIATPWSQKLSGILNEKIGGKEANDILHQYANSFSVSYQNRFGVKNAYHDIVKVEKLLAESRIQSELYQSKNNDGFDLKIYNIGNAIPLSKIMPVLESFGIVVEYEHTYGLEKLGNIAFINYFRVKFSSENIKLGDVKSNFEEFLSKILNDDESVTELNQLAIVANLNFRFVFLLNSYRQYLHQIKFTYSDKYIASALALNFEVTKLLVKAFLVKFDIGFTLSIAERERKFSQISTEIKGLLEKVSDSSHDMILRRFLNLIDASIRTNFFQAGKSYVSIKFDCKKVVGMPLPVPFAEIFVFSNDMEGTHLRGSKVARGGIRWSDRFDDFRTEVLALVKAQMTKNAAIVPSGSKGCFIIKKGNPTEYGNGVAAYKIFLSGILDITDNVVNGEVQHPKFCVIHDKADPYLVVAADKGTAKFSDIANSISKEYNFWLDDAFASGGSNGYDHKQMGITAKGAWISVERHFAELGVDIKSESGFFTAIGVGDMSGDVFGNGMLLSKKMKLVAAFSYSHIFIDPNPDAEISYKERKRLFDTLGNWDKYDTSLISKGGGVFSRKEKLIAVSKEMRELLDIEEDQVSPDELMVYILKARVDLFWNGGIGTYVKASNEGNAEVGDKANDAIRVNGEDLRCRIVGEGGNLGFTQRGRIEFAQKGGKINNDSIDNVGGVACSDREVNIKIALIDAMKRGKINLDERNKILSEMTSNVERLVLENNVLQTQSVSITEFEGYNILSDQIRLISDLEASGLLNRKIEFLPSDEEMVLRRANNMGLTRPELCVLLSYSKMSVRNAIAHSKIVSDRYFEKDLLGYFPEQLCKKFRDQAINHQLRSEIIATILTNSVVNKMGSSFVNKIAGHTRRSVEEVLTVFVATKDIFDLENLWNNIEKLDIASGIKNELLVHINRSVEKSVHSILLSDFKYNGNLVEFIDSVKPNISKISQDIERILPEQIKSEATAKIQFYISNGVEDKIAKFVVYLESIVAAFEIFEISRTSGVTEEEVARMYYNIGVEFRMRWMRYNVSQIQPIDDWEKIAIKEMIFALYKMQVDITRRVIKAKKSLDVWMAERDDFILKFHNFVSELQAVKAWNITHFSVTINRIVSLLSNLN